MAFSFDLGLAISAERYGAISAGPEHGSVVLPYRERKGMMQAACVPSA